MWTGEPSGVDHNSLPDSPCELFFTLSIIGDFGASVLAVTEEVLWRGKIFFPSSTPTESDLGLATGGLGECGEFEEFSSINSAVNS